MTFRAADEVARGGEEDAIPVGDRIDLEVAEVEPDAVPLHLVAGRGGQRAIHGKAGLHGDDGGDRAADVVLDDDAVEGVAGDDVARIGELAADDVRSEEHT